MSKPKPSELPLHDLSQRHPGVTKGLGDTYTEAARVCLDRHHVSPTEITIDATTAASTAIAQWQQTSERERGAWNNEIDTTESGAYGVALATVELAEGMVAIRRAETHTGSDYYIAPPNTSSDDLESWLRLEVSGVDRGDNQMVEQRLKQKVAQAQKGDSNLPALAAVVGFRAKYVVVAKAD